MIGRLFGVEGIREVVGTDAGETMGVGAGVDAAGDVLGGGAAVGGISVCVGSWVLEVWPGGTQDANTTAITRPPRTAGTILFS